MAELPRMICYAAIAFTVNFSPNLKTAAQGNTVATSTVQFTPSSSQSVERLSTVAPTRTTTTATNSTSTGNTVLLDLECPDGVQCSDLGASCIKCDYNYSCTYGEEVEVKCEPISSSIKCTGSPTFKRTFTCRYCYQTDPKNHICKEHSGCKVVSSPRERYQTNCTVKDNILCLVRQLEGRINVFARFLKIPVVDPGNRTFPKLLLCDWTSGYRWSTSVLLSLTLGGFGVDRFYLGHWREGLGKLFSFGGLGVWTLVDLILIIIGYVGPEDGSLYIF